MTYSDLLFALLVLCTLAVIPIAVVALARHRARMAERLLQNEGLLRIARKGISWWPVEGDTGDRGVNIFTQVLDGTRYVVFFNYGDAARTYSVPLSRLGVGKGTCTATELFSGEVVDVVGEFKVTVPASDVKLYRLK